MGKEPAEQSESISTKIRKMLTDLGPSGIVMVIAAIFSITLLLKDDLGSLSGKNVSSAQSSVEVKHKEQITAIFESIEGVTVDSINISYKTVADSSTTLFASSQTDTVSNGVVIVYRGTLKASYDVTQAISLLLDVPIHQISILNASELGGN
ncbi:MAG: hypothetical protein Q3980_04205 [Turicibacter sp.]|nr:hypothetical protein [Turicibacter sp.]